jgi:hypothetical protein
MENNNPLKGGYHSLVEEVFHAALQSQIGKSYDNENEAVNIWSSDDKSVKKWKKGMTATVISRIFEEKLFEQLIKQKSRGQKMQRMRRKKS